MGALLLDGERQVTDETLPDGRSLKFLKDAELHHPSIIEQICEWWGCTPDIALKAKGKELLRRTMTTERPV